MVGEGVEEELTPEEPRPVDEWPPPSSNLELTNKDGTSSRLLFLTVQYVEEEPSTSYSSGLESFSELERQVVSPLDPNMGCTACYSPSTPLLTAPMSPSSSYLNPPSPPTTEPGMIVLSDSCQFTSADQFVVASGSRMYTSEQDTDDAKQLLLLSSNANNSSELVVTGDETCGDQRVELLLSNGTIAYGIVESLDDDGTRVIQIPSEYLVATGTETNDLPMEDANVQIVENVQVEQQSVQDEDIQDDSSQLRAFYDTLKEQGLIIEPGELRLESDLDSQQLIDASLLDQATLSDLGSAQQLNSPTFPLLPLQKRFWCEECNVLMETNCREHQVNRKISDKIVPSRARATLPASYLSIDVICDTGSEEYGVFARKNIPKRTQFGPMEGVFYKPVDLHSSDLSSPLELSVETETGDMKILDVSNEHMSNWMRFVRVATPDRPPNLLLSQLGASLFFTTTHMITQRQELLVWYSPSYASRRNLSPDPPPPEWPCSICGKKLRNANELVEHSICHKLTPKREENLTMDSLRRKNQAVVACLKKDIAERNTQGAQKHWFECAICRKKLHRPDSLKRHIQLMHARENRYHCKVCHLSFSHSYNQLRHMRKVHPNHKDVVQPKNGGRYGSWSCSHCDLTFSSAFILNLHKLVHSATDIDEENDDVFPEDIQDIFVKPHERISCPQCSQKFSNKGKLAIHVAEHGKAGNPKNSKFHCDVCGRNFHSADRFEIHSKLHRENEKKPLQCNVCHRRFLNKSALTVHLKVHECLAQWECPMCKEHFSTVLALRSHVHTHAVQGFYRCPHCSKAFEEYSGIRKHVRSFHSDRKFACSDCSMAFATQDKLRMHLLRHSDHREFLCADCGKQFKRKDKLKEHMKRVHLNKNVDVTSSSEKESFHDKKTLSKLVIQPSEYERYIYKCHSCTLGFKQRGMLVNHLANRHPDITPESVPELNLPILKTTRDYFCQYCDKNESCMTVRQIQPSDYERYIYKCHSCMLGFKRRGMLVNHLANRHPDITPDSVPELNLPILKTTRDYFCQYCDKIYKSSSKRKAHILKNHPGLDLPMSNRQKGGIPEIPGLPNPTYSQTVGSVTTNPQGCQWCHKQYASKAKLMQHQRKKHTQLMTQSPLQPQRLGKMARSLNLLDPEENNENESVRGAGVKHKTLRIVKFEDVVQNEPIPVALSTNINHQIVLNSNSEYDILDGEDDVNNILECSTKRSSYKNDNISSDLLSQAMSEIGVSMSDLRGFSSDQCFKLVQSPGCQDQLYTPYTPR